jgi:hypothetical protein
MNEHETESKRVPSTGTGEIIGKGSIGQTIIYPFGPYEVLLRLSNSGEFIEIIEIRLNKDFRTFKQKAESRGFHDVNDIYEDK